jgi:hypothetical protein
MGIGTSPSDLYFLYRLPEIFEHIVPRPLPEGDPRIGNPFILTSNLAADVLGTTPDRKVRIQALTELRGRLVKLTNDLDAEITQLKRQTVAGP